MGRHADPDGGAFWRSLGASATRALVVLGVGAIVALAILQATGDQPDGGDDVALEASAAPAVLDPEATDAPTDVPAPPDPSRAAPDPGAAAPAEDGTPDLAPAPTEIPADAAPAPAPDGDAEPAIAAPVAAAPPPQETTVQVLDGVGGDGRQARAAADVLRSLGYDVVVVNPAGLDYAETQVQFSTGHDDAAAALAGQDPRFSAIGPSRNLSDEIDLHVIVGSDFTS